MKAEQEDNPNQASTAVLHIDTDQQRSLSFRPCNYNVTLPENSPPGTQVVQLIADDPNHVWRKMICSYFTCMKYL